ncbi:hypothetical protein BU16DRAFT_456334 [Lophium mytilinum]|uniref:Uncharacterized protein n=1 Tax=Lophium mytilinum TaxID=390894 RepID=A0A6A6R1K8_9PEZI|nr:hypothetical protein BU16DRAFT_456334 [Lophium mytilinum]
MASTINDRWLWLGLGSVLTFVAFKGVAHGLREVTRLSETVEHPRSKKAPPPTSENVKSKAIKTESLETLALCSNVDIRKAATDLLCNRLVNNKDAHRLLAKDFHSGDPERVARVHKCLLMLQDHELYIDLCDPDNPRIETMHQVRLQQSRTAGRMLRTRQLSDTALELAALRRRRREAMVLNEGDRPVSQEDIIQGGGGMSDEDVRVAEQALETLSRRDREFDFPEA